MNKGLFLCIEGQDGTGKTVQHELLSEALVNARKPVLEIDIPRYGKPSSELVALYLNGEFGDPVKLDPRLASLPYAIDRLAAKPGIEQALSRGEIVLANRFTASNMAHQGAKLATKQERLVFFEWIHRLEHDIMSIPEPDYHFVLHLPAEIARERVLLKVGRSYTHKKLDGHEADLNYQKRAEQTYLDLAHVYPDSFILIECMDGDKAKSPEEIHKEVWEKVQKLSRDD